MGTNAQVERLLKEINENNNKTITVYSLDGCPACNELKFKLNKLGVVYETIEMGGNDTMWQQLKEGGGSDFVPQVKVENYLIKENEYSDVNQLVSKTLSTLLNRKIIIK